MKLKPVPYEVMPVLSGLAYVPSGVQITDQIDRKLYTKVNDVLEALGGKWDRKAKAHIFPEGSNPESLVEGVLLTGQVAKADNDFFQTPPVLAATLAVDARLQHGQRILEPSAGGGALVDAILDHFGRPHVSTTIRVLEVQPELASALADKYVDQPTVLVHPVDFLDWAVEGPEYRYDRIVMNPPFSKRRDAKHVLHAYSLLKPGGRLVAIMGAGVKFRQEREYREVRELIHSVGSIEDLPGGTFKESGTMVNAVVITLDKPEDWTC